MPNILTNVFGSRNERVLKQLSKIVARINALEPEMQKLDDAALKGKTAEFKQRIAGGESLDKLLPGLPWHAPAASAGGCIALFTFDELCNRPLGAGAAWAVGSAHCSAAVQAAHACRTLHTCASRPARLLQQLGTNELPLHSRLNWQPTTSRWRTPSTRWR